jgi:hypothetical protein
MHVPGFLARPKLLIASMIGIWLTGSAWGEQAGRVNFVVGDAAAVKPDNSRRPLTRGDVVNSGERLETGSKSRIQIRFTDGSFLSLQPNTTFGLDTYNYNRDKPDQSTLVFNFLKGSMRTISGAIGKVNRANYAIKTPSATIGIRGTDYAGVINNNQLLLNVLGGIVNLSNAKGSADVLTGQTFIVRMGEAPALFQGAFPGQIDNIEPDAESTQTSGNGGAGATPTPPLATAVAGAAALEDMPERPRLENYENYNQFLQAMYAFKKAEAARSQAAQPTPAAPVIDIEKLKGMAPLEADLDTETVQSAEVPSLVTEGPETIEGAVAMAQTLKLPHYSPGENYHRSSFKSFPLMPVETQTLENSSINDTFRFGAATENRLLAANADVISNDTGNLLSTKPELNNKSLSIRLDSGDFTLRFLGNVIQIQGINDMEISWQVRN